MDNGTKKVTNTESYTVTTNNEENNGEVAKAEVEAVANTATNSAKLNSSNNGIGSSNSKSYYAETKILKRTDKNGFYFDSKQCRI